jgi:uncharacterized protein YdiU (UPF0061 family)
MAVLHALLQLGEVDMTLWFRALSRFDPERDAGAQLDALLGEAFYVDDKRAQVREGFVEWLQWYAGRLREDARPAEERRAAMDRTNPKFVLRNYLAQEVIDRAEQGDTAGIDALLDVMRHPYDDQPGRERFAAKRPDWARTKAGCSMLSCSS